MRVCILASSRVSVRREGVFGRRPHRPIDARRSLVPGVAPELLDELPCRKDAGTRRRTQATVRPGVPWFFAPGRADETTVTGEITLSPGATKVHAIFCGLASSVAKTTVCYLESVALPNEDKLVNAALAK
jgi:hypothetical protein